MTVVLKIGDVSEIKYVLEDLFLKISWFCLEGRLIDKIKLLPIKTFK